jgi:hypothetical protein
VAGKTVEKHPVHDRQLYQPLSVKKASSEELALALGRYVTGWQLWVNAGLWSWLISPDGIKHYQDVG